MLTGTKITGKLEQILPHYRALRFENIADLEVEMQETRGMLLVEPKDGDWVKVARGGRWGGDWISAWFRGEAVVPEHAAGKRIFVGARTGGTEALLIVDGMHKGTFNDQHPFVAMGEKVSAGRHHIAIESYSGHGFPGTQPNDAPIVVGDKGCIFESVTLQMEREDVSEFVYDLDVLLSLLKVTDANSLRRGSILRGLEQVWAAIPAFPSERAEGEWRPALVAARRIMAPLLSVKNGPTAPTIALVAHSHIDTAWLWPIAETRRKTGRTFSSMVSLMERYPEVVFLQSVPCHAEMTKEDYPQVFERMKKLIAEGRWEPNGASWIEPDCNLTGGEALVRQFLVGITWTREHYGYSPDAFWQPDVFGYSAALPQILRGFNIEYFLTTKMAWNDTTRFPYDTFVWQGIDGSTVLTHLNSLPQFINAHNVAEMWNWAQHKDSESQRLASYGWGDGGGGPTMEDMEIVRRLADLEGAPKTRYTTVSGFMKELRDSGTPWPRWVGELYLELHRGTLTSIAEVKRGNRKAETALRDTEFHCTLAAVCGMAYPSAELLAVWKKLLINQFHDILPGTSIARVNDEAIHDFAEVIDECRSLSKRALSPAGGGAGSPCEMVLVNSLSWERTGELAIPIPEDSRFTSVEGAVAQRVTNLAGEALLVTHGLHVPALGARRVMLEEEGVRSESVFQFDIREDASCTLKTPHGTVQFLGDGRICSYELGEARRDLVGTLGSINEFRTGEDVPLAWDNWDIDSDQSQRMTLETRLTRREVVADGPLQFRLLQEFRIGSASQLRQHIVFHAASPRVTFETEVQWHEKHTLLKVFFDLNLHCESARHEIQYGHVERPTHQNYPQDRARFEVCAHKWTDISDNGFGVALLNDCKYGVSVEGSRIGLSLLKSGTHPDPRGDNGTHRFAYEVLPHDGAFSVPFVVRPAYEFNVPIHVHPSGESRGSFIEVDAANVIVEAIKWAEDGSGFIVRVFEAGRMETWASIRMGIPVKAVLETNLLEEEKSSVAIADGIIHFRMKPFEIKTFKFIR
ncbi:alpha-mannosidase [Candidatus Sumerlaeota bacterium]|nr:alpha-mannosidase [Candidatus Sumerlaeota bacterium]